jgi:hypothetical protein
MPELTWRFGYFAALGTMAVLGLGLVGVFWRLGWLGTGAAPGGRRKKPRSG